MGTITAKAIIDKVSVLLNDATNVRWLRTELLSWLSQAQRSIAIRNPGTVNTVAVMKLQVGTRQSIASSGWQLLDINRNMGTDGLTPGAPIRIISQELLDAFSPNWHAATPTSAVDNFIYSPKDETSFFVYPPSDGTGYVEVNYASITYDFTAETDTIKVPDIFEPTLTDYMCFRAHSKDAEYAAGMQLAGMFFSSFNAALQAKEQAELQASPNLDLAAFDPTVRGSGG